MNCCRNRIALVLVVEDQIECICDRLLRVVGRAAARGDRKRNRVKKDGSTITVSAFTDEKGRYSFPAAWLEPGHYTIGARAAGL
jgi:hypothetical protein